MATTELGLTSLMKDLMLSDIIDEEISDNPEIDAIIDDFDMIQASEEETPGAIIISNPGEPVVKIFGSRQADSSSLEASKNRLTGSGNLFELSSSSIIDDYVSSQSSPRFLGSPKSQELSRSGSGFGGSISRSRILNSAEPGVDVVNSCQFSIIQLERVCVCRKRASLLTWPTLRISIQTLLITWWIRVSG